MATNGLIENTLLDHWDKQQAKEKLDDFYRQTLTNVDSTIKWYWENKRGQRIPAKIIRIAATILFICSTLVPYLANYLGGDLKILYIGYVLAGLGGGLLLIDKYSTFSTSWVRYVLLGQQLQTLRNSFVINWQVIYLKYTPLTPYNFSQIMETLLVFQTAFNAAIKAETEAWAKEFQNNLGDLLSAIQSQSATLKTQIDEQKRQATVSDPPSNKSNVDIANIISAADKFKQQIIGLDNVTSVILNTESEASHIDVHVSKNFDSKTLIPTKVFYTSTSNQTCDIPVKIVSDFDPMIHSQLWPADIILNQYPYPNNRGSIGGKVYDINTKDAYFLSCFHVVKSPAHDWNFVPNGNETILEFQNGSICGSIVNAIRDDKIDAAIMKAADDYVIMDGINGIGVPHFIRDINDNDKKYKTKVKMYGGVTRQLTTGYVMDINVPANILYFKAHTTDTEYYRIDSLIFIKSNDGSAFSQPGDSGSMVIDEYNYLIGILLGGQDNVSYVMPITTIFNRLNLKINML